MSAGREPFVYAWVAILAWLMHGFLDASFGSPAIRYVFAGIAIFAGVMTIASLISVIRFWRLISFIKKPSGLHGRIKFPKAQDAEELGLRFDNKDGNGIPLGGAGKKIICWHGKGHASIRAPTEGGKTESSAVNICMALGKHRNIITTGKGPDIAIMTTQHRESIGQRVFNIDHWQTLKPHGLQSHYFNPLGHLVPLGEKNDPIVIDKARGISQILKPDPERGGGENQIFLSVGREILAKSISHLASLEAETGELVCNLGTLYQRLSGSPDDLKAFFQEMRRSDAFDGAISRAGNRFLGMMERSGKSFESFLTEALDGLAIYEPSGILARNADYSTFDPSDIKTPGKPTSINIVIPPEFSHSHGSFAGLCLNALVDIAISADRFEPRLTVIADEFASLSQGKIPSILPLLYLGRSRGIQLITYVQDTETYSRYGREKSAFTTQSEIVMAWGIRSTKDAEEYSKRSGKRAVVEESGSVPLSGLDGAGGQASFGLHQKGIAHLRPDEFMQLADFSAALFYKQLSPLIVDLVSYRSVEPWRHKVRPVPGAPPSDDLPVKYKA